jgi:hypothetical protein
MRHATLNYRIKNTKRPCIYKGSSGTVCYNEQSGTYLLKYMMRTLKFASLFAVCAIALTAPFSASAQNAQQGQDAPPPPKLEKLEEGEAPGVTVREPKDKQTVTESRAPGGQVKEVKVTKGKNTYYLRPNVAPGSALPGDAQSPHTRPAQWTVYEFNKKRIPGDPDTETAPPPPQTVPAAPVKK